MLAAVLNICTQEELKESSEGSSAPSAAPADRDLAERRKVIKNKILAVGRMAHFFSLLRYVLRLLSTRPTCSLYTARSQSGYRSSRASRARQDCHMARSHSALRVSRTPSRPSMTRTSSFILLSTAYWDSIPKLCRRKSDIENERLPPVDERQPASSWTIPGASANSGPTVSVTPRANPVVPPVTTFKRPKDGKVTQGQAQRR